MKDMKIAGPNDVPRDVFISGYATAKQRKTQNCTRLLAKHMAKATCATGYVVKARKFAGEIMFDDFKVLSISCDDDEECECHIDKRSLVDMGKEDMVGSLSAAMDTFMTTWK